MKPEAIIQSRIQGALKSCGYLSIHIPNRGSFNPFTKRYNIVTDPWFVPGVPDLVVLLPHAQVLWIEVKTATGQRSISQVRMAARLSDLGHNYLLARDVQTVMEWLKTHCFKYAEKA